MSFYEFSSESHTRTLNANDNLKEVFNMIRSIDHTHVSVEIEYAGVNISPGPEYDRFRHPNPSDLYGNLKRTIEDYKPLQAGLTIADAVGNLFVFEFNFNDFDPSRDRYSAEWIENLKQKEIDLQRNHDYGIESVKFAELLMSSGLVCNSEKVKWVSFHSAYDFGYLLKMMTGRDLPDDLSQFLVLLKTFFGENVYDVKHLMKHFKGLHGGLEQVAKKLNLKVESPDGKTQLAGANSLLTWNVFQKIKDLCGGEPEKFGGVIYGLGPF